MASSQVQVASLGRSPALDAVTNRIPNPFTTKPPTPAADSDATPAPTPAATASTGAEPQLISTGSLSGRESKRVTPVYPSQAKTHNVTGTVRVFAIVDENGKIWVTNSEGPVLLRKAAEEAARGWTFPPSLVNNKPVRLAGYIDFDFKL
jgi:protein TonB